MTTTTRWPDETLPEPSATRPMRPWWLVPDALSGAIALTGSAILIAVAGGGSLAGAMFRAVVVTATTLLLLRLCTSGGRVRATAALLAGLAGIVVGAGIAILHAAATGLSIPTLAGSVALIVGLGLAGTGTVALVRSVHGARRWLALPFAFVVLQFVVQPATAAILVTNPPRSAMGPGTPADHGLEADEVTFRTSDGVTLAGWYVPARNRAALVVVPGSGSDRTATLDQASVLARHGYGALLLDPRGHGRSEGEGMDLGWFGELDIGAAVTFLTERPEIDATRIGVLGLSMGGEAGLTAAATDPRIRAVVGEGVQRRVAADEAESPSGPQGWIEWVTIREQMALADLLTDASQPMGLRDAVRQTAPRRMLLIAGAGEEALDRSYQAVAPDAVELWEVPDAPHVGALATHPADWERRVISFLDRELAR